MREAVRGALRDGGGCAHQRQRDGGRAAAAERLPTSQSIAKRGPSASGQRRQNEMPPLHRCRQRRLHRGRGRQVHKERAQRACNKRGGEKQEQLAERWRRQAEARAEQRREKGHVADDAVFVRPRRLTGFVLGVERSTLDRRVQHLDAFHLRALLQPRALLPAEACITHPSARRLPSRRPFRLRPSHPRVGTRSSLSVLVRRGRLPWPRSCRHQLCLPLGRPLAGPACPWRRGQPVPPSPPSGGGGR